MYAICQPNKPSLTPHTGRTTGKKYDFGRIKVAFQTYKQLFGDLLVQAKYVVPQNDDAWPRETWGIKLGTYTQLVSYGLLLMMMVDFLQVAMVFCLVDERCDVFLLWAVLRRVI